MKTSDVVVLFFALLLALGAYQVMREADARAEQHRLDCEACDCGPAPYKARYIDEKCVCVMVPIPPEKK